MMEAAKKMFGCKCNYQRDMDTWGERVRIAWQQIQKCTVENL